MVYNSSKSRLDTHIYYFKLEEEFKLAQEKLKGINLTHRDGIIRNLWVFVNPISGRRLARHYYQNILLPALTFTGLKHEMFETDSEEYVERFIEKLDPETASFTDFIVIGGDGLFNQLINAIMKHPQKDLLRNIPIGIIPGGSSNSLWCDLNWKDPFMAVLNTVRGEYINGDMFHVTMKDWEKKFDESNNYKTNYKSLYSSALTYGTPVDLILDSQNLRAVFGRYRYIAWGVKKYLNPKRIADYHSEIYYKEEQEEKTPEANEKEDSYHSVDVNSLSRPRINIPRVSPIKTKSMSQGTCEDEKWKKLNIDEFWYYAVATHEIRSSINSEIVAPFTRINDGNMYLFGMKACNRFAAIKYLSRVSDHTHLTYEKFFFQKVTELKIKNPEGSYFWVDGEPFKSDELQIKLMPGFLKLMGQTH